ncbi:MAG: hypothetical protein ABI635_02395 [Actinomycetota bacterium]
MRVDHPKPPRYPWWQLVLLGLAGLAESAVWPLRRMWKSDRPLDAYALAHFTSAAGDALIAIALADSVFFSLPVDQAKVKVALYLGLTMLPLALAGPLLVIPLDRAGPRRATSLAAALVRSVVAVIAAPRVDSLLLFPLALALLVASKVHAISKNGLTMSYADRAEGLMRANARLGRVAVGGAIWAAPFGFVLLRLFGAQGPMYLAGAVFAVSAALTLRLHPPRPGGNPRPVGPRGRMRALTLPAIGAVGMRAASGFLLFLLAFSLRRGGQPAWWFAVLAGAAVAGGFLADLVAPRFPPSVREEAMVVSCVLGAGLCAGVAFEWYALAVLAIFALVAGAATELGRLAFQSLMQRNAPEGALGRVFVRYEILFQLAWVAGAFLPAVLPIEFRTGILILAGFYLILAGTYYVRRRQDSLSAGDERRP